MSELGEGQNVQDLGRAWDFLRDVLGNVLPNRSGAIFDLAHRGAPATYDPGQLDNLYR